MEKRLVRWIAGLVTVALTGSAAPAVLADDGTATPASTVSATPTPDPSALPSPSPQPPVPTPSVPTPPVLVSSRPVVKGTAKVGHLVSAATPGWTDGVRFVYRWLRNGTPIKGATSATYWLTRADQGKRVSVVVTGTLAGAAPRVKTSTTVRVTSGSTGTKLTKPFLVKGVWVISKDHRVAKSYLKKGKGVLGSDKTASDALKKMLKAAKKAGFNVTASWGYRSFSTQTAVWKRNVKALGKKRGEQLAAPPGASEHNAGLAFDLRSGGKGQYAFGNSKAGRWVAKNAWKYGFILRYPKGKTKITGYRYEPWHFRYIGTEHSKAFAKRGSLTLEEYLGLA